MNKDDKEFYEKYGLADGTSWIRIDDKPTYLTQVTHNLKNDTRWVVVMDKQFNVIHEIQLYNMVNKESVKEFKIKGDSSGGGWEEITQHRVWILTADGCRKCPWCGKIPGNYSDYNDPHYLADHRAGQCSECKRFSFVTHDHIDGICQPIPPDSLKNFKKV